MKRAVIFDLDGTLLNTLPDIAAAMNRALIQAGLPAHPEDLQAVHRRWRKESDPARAGEKDGPV